MADSRCIGMRLKTAKLGVIDGWISYRPICGARFCTSREKSTLEKFSTHTVHCRDKTGVFAYAMNSLGDFENSENYLAKFWTLDLQTLQDCILHTGRVYDILWPSKASGFGASTLNVNLYLNCVDAVCMSRVPCDICVSPLVFQAVALTRRKWGYCAGGVMDPW